MFPVDDTFQVLLAVGTFVYLRFSRVVVPDVFKEEVERDREIVEKLIFGSSFYNLGDLLESASI